MSFIDKPSEGRGYQPGWFLAHEECTRITKQFNQDGRSSDMTVNTAPNGGKYVPMGSVYKENGQAVGLVYEDVDVTTGNMPGSVVTAGKVYDDRVASGAKGALSAVTAIQFVGNAPTVSRPTSAPVISASGTIQQTEGGNLDVTADKPFQGKVSVADFTLDANSTSAAINTVTYRDANKVQININGSPSQGTFKLTAKASAFLDSTKDSNTVSVEVTGGD